jgi:hypothetical protein
VVVGGAYVASRGVRTSTTDVDTVDELFDPGTGTPLLLAGGLEIIAPPSDIIVLMKIAAGGRTPNDALDLRSLWPTTSFLDTEQAVAAFYAAYPHEEPDPHLADWIRSVVGR